ncbi:response regulator [Modestobacter sp. VKM Ac-2986]|uniref:Hpt domain-containing response regulator n=1 Tax=Modestobacter sp. VKM Ac-2986 TaxID=3004140 RepID=UPI0022AB95E9|nr:response regulator [Modestobacter sp. VKM Ac-2986]MCZ2830789.1 response regulator [Modestobacter sp. VKM Ac-2986]
MATAVPDMRNEETTVANVLVVEDEDVTRLMLESRLTIAGHHVRAAASMDEAQELMELVFSPEVLVTDMFMPGGSGLALASAVRRDPLHADLPVIFLSARALPGDVEAGTALDATYLAKPVAMTDLTQAIDTALDISAAARGEVVREHATGLWNDEDDAERELYARLLTLFVEQSPEMLAVVVDAMRDRDAVAVEATAHRLRGAAASLGAGPLARLCETLEDAGRARDLPPLAPLLSPLRRELEVTRQVFTELAAELAG